MKKVLTIAGSDCSGGAGIQADLKTISAFGIYGMSVITALTAQNTLGVNGVCTTDKEFTRLQIRSVFEDIFPDAVKIGMLSDSGNIQVIKEELERFKAKNIVLDTVMVSTSGHPLMDKDAKEVLIKELLPVADIITPNTAEAEALSRVAINEREDMVKAAKVISGMTDAAVLIKGGHLKDCADDMLYHNREIKWYRQAHIDNENTHGTGCTLSSAIACGLAKGLTVEESVLDAKKYITEAIRAGLDIGRGRGPLNHMYRM